MLIGSKRLGLTVLTEDLDLVLITLGQPKMVIMNLGRGLKSVDVKSLILTKFLHGFGRGVKHGTVDLDPDVLKVRRHLERNLEVVVMTDLQVIELLGRGRLVNKVLGLDLNIDVLQKI